MQVRTYRFEPIDTCEMCEAPASHHKVLGLRLDKSQGRSPRQLSGIAVGVKQCLQCDLIFPDPLPVPLNLTDHYALDPDKYWAPDYFEVSENYFANEIATAKRLLEFKPGMTALDIGAGFGKAMKSLTRSGFDTFGIEPSPTFRKAAVERNGIPEERIIQSSLEEAEIDSKFDFITFGAVLEHLYHPAAAIERALTWLKPSGVIQIEVPSSSHLIAKILNAYYKLRGTNYVTNLSPMHSPFHLYEFSVDSFAKHGASANYAVIEHEFHQNDVLFVPIPRIFHPPLSYFMKKNRKGMQLTVWLQPTSPR